MTVFFKRLRLDESHPQPSLWQVSEISFFLESRVCALFGELWQQVLSNRWIMGEGRVFFFRKWRFCFQKSRTSVFDDPVVFQNKASGLKAVSAIKLLYQLNGTAAFFQAKVIPQAFTIQMKTRVVLW